MTTKTFLFLFSLVILSCASSPQKKTYTLILSYKEHERLNDNVPIKELREKIKEEDDAKAYSSGIDRFSFIASSWNDTAFGAPIEPLSFKVIDNNNVDVRTIIDKNTIQKLDSLMWVDIKLKREKMSKTKSNFLKSVDTIHGGLTNLVDSLVKNGNSKPRNKK